LPNHGLISSIFKRADFTSALFFFFYKINNWSNKMAIKDGDKLPAVLSVPGYTDFPLPPDGGSFGRNASDKLSFHGIQPVIMRSNVAQAAVATTAPTNTTPYGFTTSAQAQALITLVNELRAAMVEIGIIKGS
jgi:hypothetical protein